MSRTTLIEIYQDDLPTWRRWCKVKGLRSKDLMSEIMREVGRRHQRELYLSLPRPDSRKKPLLGKKIEGNFKR